MSALDLTAFAATLAVGTKAHVQRELAAVKAEFANQLDTLAHAADATQIKADLSAEMRAAMREYLAGEMAGMMRDLVREEVGRMMAGVQMPRDGRDGKDVDLLAVKTLVEAAVTAVPSVDVAPLVRDAVTAALATWPRPKDGRDGIDGKDGRDGIDGKDGAAGLAGKDGAPGVMGQKGDPGPAGLPGMQGAKGDPGERGLMGEKGMDGLQGRDGRDGLPGVPGPMGEKGLDGLHGKDGRDGINGKDGADGLHGKDGLAFTAATTFLDDQRGVFLRLSDGEQTKELPLYTPWYAGVWQYGRVYPKAAEVTAKGALWYAERDAPGKPGDPDSGWRLCVKAGQDGKPGPPGRDGHGD